MGVEKKDILVENLEIFGDAFTRVIHFVTRLTPIGVFAIAASAGRSQRGAQPNRRLSPVSIENSTKNMWMSVSVPLRLWVYWYS
jgi:hypothetical protein